MTDRVAVEQEEAAAGRGGAAIGGRRASGRRLAVARAAGGRRADALRRTIEIACAGDGPGRATSRETLQGRGISAVHIRDAGVLALAAHAHFPEKAIGVGGADGGRRNAVTVRAADLDRRVAIGHALTRLRGARAGEARGIADVDVAARIRKRDAAVGRRLAIGVGDATPIARFAHACCDVALLRGGAERSAIGRISAAIGDVARTRWWRGNAAMRAWITQFVHAAVEIGSAQMQLAAARLGAAGVEAAIQAAFRVARASRCADPSVTADGRRRMAIVVGRTDRSRRAAMRVATGAVRAIAVDVARTAGAARVIAREPFRETAGRGASLREMACIATVTAVRFSRTSAGTQQS